MTAWGAGWRSHPGRWGRPGVSCQGGLAPGLLPGCLTSPSSPPHGAGGPRTPRRLTWTQAASSPACCGHCAQQAAGSQNPPASVSLRPPSPGFLTSRSCDPGTQPSGLREKVSRVPGHVSACRRARWPVLAQRHLTGCVESRGRPPEVSTAVTPAAWPHADPHLGPGPRTPGPPSSPAPRFPVAEVPLGVIPSAGSSASCFP